MNFLYQNIYVITEILKATKGRLVTDNYEFVLPFDFNKVEFDVAGTRHCSDVNSYKDLINVNDKLLLELQPTNEYDENAIKVILKKMEIHIIQDMFLDIILKNYQNY